MVETAKMGKWGIAKEVDAAATQQNQASIRGGCSPCSGEATFISQADRGPPTMVSCFEEDGWPEVPVKPARKAFNSTKTRGIPQSPPMQPHHALTSGICVFLFKKPPQASHVLPGTEGTHPWPATLVSREGPRILSTFVCVQRGSRNFLVRAFVLTCHQKDTAVCL